MPRRNRPKTRRRPLLELAGPDLATRQPSLRYELMARNLVSRGLASHLILTTTPRKTKETTR